VVNVEQNVTTAQLRDLLSRVTDPEIPVLTLEDLGVIREIRHSDGKIEVTITPTYAGCPALETMRSDIEATLAAAGFGDVTVRQSLSPAWTTDWMSDGGREKLRAYGIAPPARKACNEAAEDIGCPQCGSADVKRISEFGSTACKALYRCRDCLEPFDYFKCL
jgi:ring-1,2-phenylacetyl-CoA epoxidase subunit PaaD